MSRARDRIARAVESRGWKVEALEWEPIYAGGEKEGLGGGWSLVVDRPFLANTWPGDDLGGLSVEELLADIDYWLTPPESCACDLAGRVHPLIGVGLKPGNGNPERPMHKTACRWFVRYQLRYWHPEVADA